MRNFIIGVTYMKTETLQEALLGILLFEEKISFLGCFFIFLGTIGLFLLTPAAKNRNILQFITHKNALLGLACGFFMAICSFFMKEAMQLANNDNPIIYLTLAFIFINLFQNLIAIIYQFFRKKLFFSLNNMFTHWKQCYLISYTSLLGTIFWLYAFSLQTIAYVKLLSQIEILFAFFISHKFFKETTNIQEILGIFLIALSICFIIFL